MIVVWLYLAMPRVSLQFVIVVLPDHTHLLFLLLLPTHQGADILQLSELNSWAYFNSLFQSVSDSCQLINCCDFQWYTALC